MRLGLVWLVVLGIAACANEDSDGMSDGGGDGGAGPIPEPVCLDGDGEAGACAVEPVGEVCSAADNPACAPIRVVEVLDAADGPCLRLEIDNDCEDTLYSRTCIELMDDGEVQLQCWTSTTLPGFSVDVGECGVTGNWWHWSSHSSGMLDVIETTCEPEE